jgi:hypothetical protein
MPARTAALFRSKRPFMAPHHAKIRAEGLVDVAERRRYRPQLQISTAGRNHDNAVQQCGHRSISIVWWVGQAGAAVTSHSALQYAHSIRHSGHTCACLTRNEAMDPHSQPK